MRKCRQAAAAEPMSSIPCLVQCHLVRCAAVPGNFIRTQPQASPSHCWHSSARQRLHSPSSSARPERHLVHFPVKSSQAAQPKIGQAVQFTPSSISGKKKP